MIHLFHGEDIVLSRKELSIIKDKFSVNNIIWINGKTVSFTDLYQAAESKSLLDERRLIVVENFFSVNLKKNLLLKNIKLWLKQTASNHELVFWEGRELPKTIINLFPESVDIAIFKIKTSLFLFLESVKPSNSDKVFILLDQILKTEPPELVFSMLVRQIRLLLLVKFDQTTDMSSWQKIKIVKQAQLFSKHQLLSMYRQLLNLEYQFKDGLTYFNLTDQLKFFLINIGRNI